MTISVPLLLWLWFAHWVGDFVLQTDEQAKAKHHSNAWLTKHVVTYTSVLFMMIAFYGYAAIWYALVNGILHWLTDYVTSRINARLWAEGRVHDFFVGIGFDQFCHLSTLVLTAWWLIGV